MNRLPRSVITAAASALFLLLAAAAATGQIAWKQAHGARIPVPSGDRPRVYLRPQHVSRLQARLDHPALASAMEEWRKLANPDLSQPGVRSGSPSQRDAGHCRDGSLWLDHGLGELTLVRSEN